MKIDTTNRILPESIPQAPDWLPNLLQPLNQSLEQLILALRKNLTFSDNFNASVGEFSMTSGTELIVANPLKTRVAAVIPLFANAQGIDSFKWTQKSTGKIGITVGFDLSSSGVIGETVESSVLQASGVTLTSTVTKTVTSISLSPGSWDVSLIGALTGTLTGTVFQAHMATAADSVTGCVPGDTWVTIPLVSSAATDLDLAIPSKRKVISATTSIYLNVTSTFSAGTAKAYGRISATRASKYNATTTASVKVLFIGDN